MMRMKKILLFLIIMTLSLTFFTIPAFADTFSSHTVKKVWEETDDGNKLDVVVVQLFRDYTPYGDPIILTEENQWTYTWDELSNQYHWSVEEMSVPADGSESKVDFDGVIVTTVAMESSDQENFGGISKEKKSVPEESVSTEIAVLAVAAISGVVILMIKKKLKIRGQK